MVNEDAQNDAGELQLENSKLREVVLVLQSKLKAMESCQQDVHDHEEPDAGVTARLERLQQQLEQERELFDMNTATITQLKQQEAALRKVDPKAFGQAVDVA